MGIPEHEKLTVDEFFDAISGSEGRYELVGGIAYAMAGAKKGTTSYAATFRRLLSRRKAEGVSHYIERHGRPTGPDTVRYPDVVVDCGPPNAAAMTASKPTIIVEVSSPGTAVFDYGAKLREYQDVESVDTVMQIESEIALVKVHRRKRTQHGPRRRSKNLTSLFRSRR